MPYDINGNAFERDSRIRLVYAVIAAIVAVIAIVIIACTVNSTDASEHNPTYHLDFDCSNTASMHEYGLPTRADVIEYHVFGRWCIRHDGEIKVLLELPGSTEVWDALYSIQDNPKFVK